MKKTIAVGDVAVVYDTFRLSLYKAEEDAVARSPFWVSARALGG